MFQFPWFASVHKAQIAVLQTAGLSHSEIPGSKVICTYPGLIAAYHVLHRLREPRHPPDALTCFRLKTNTLPAAVPRYFACGELFVSLILSAVDHARANCRGATRFVCDCLAKSLLYSLVCQYVKDLCENRTT